MMSKMIFSKYSNNRKSEFCIATSIYKNEQGMMWVEKKALNSKAQKHINRMQDSYEILVNSNKNQKVKINSCIKEGRLIRFEYVEGKLFSTILTEILDSGDYLGFIEKIKEYVNLAKSLFPLEEFKPTEEFKRVFGDITFETELQAGEFANIDFTFDNIIINDVINVIDYEWVFNFPIPINYIIYRAINVYITKESLGERINLIDICRMFGINREEILQYNKMEEHFQKYVNKSEEPIKQPVKLSEILSYKEKMQQKLTIQLFKDYGEGFSEQQSERVTVEEIEKDIYKLRIEIEEGVKKIRIDPAETYCAMQIKGAIISNEQNTEIAIYTNNAMQICGSLIFCHLDPQVIFNMESKNGVLEVIFNLEYIHIDVVKTLQELYRIQQEEAMRNQDLQERYEHIQREIQKVNSQNQILMQSADKRETILMELKNQLQSKTEMSLQQNEIIENKNKQLVEAQDVISQTSQDLVQTRHELVLSQNELAQVQDELAQVRDELQYIKNTRLWKLANKIRR